MGKAETRSWFAPALIAATILFSNQAQADWRVDYDGTVALSSDDTVVFSCMPLEAAFASGTFEVYLKTPVPSFEKPTLVFEFDTGEAFEWNKNYGGDLYIGPLMGINDNANKIVGYTARLSGPRYNPWIGLAERFMKNEFVTIVINGVKHGPISLKGSSKALSNIVYFRSPCKSL